MKNGMARWQLGCDSCIAMALRADLISELALYTARAMKSLRGWGGDQEPIWPSGRGSCESWTLDRAWSCICGLFLLSLPDFILFFGSFHFFSLFSGGEQCPSWSLSDLPDRIATCVTCSCVLTMETCLNWKVGRSVRRGVLCETGKIASCGPGGVSRGGWRGSRRQGEKAR
jgi:hypothetical protein